MAVGIVGEAGRHGVRSGGVGACRTGRREGRKGSGAHGRKNCTGIYRRACWARAIGVRVCMMSRRREAARQRRKAGVR